MPISDNFYISACDESVDTKDWIRELRHTYPLRSAIHKQTQRFYSIRKIIEYTVKATISASLAVALIWGGPAALLIGGAAVILRLTTMLLNRYNPSQYIEKPGIQFNIQENLIDGPGLAKFRNEWRNGHQEYFFKAHKEDLTSLQKRVAFALVAGYLIFTLLSANLTLPIFLASVFYADSLIQKATEIVPLYLEDEKELSNLFTPLT